MVDQKAQDKQIDSMTDKVVDREVAGASNAAANMQNDAPVEQAFLVPEKQDIDVLQKNFRASRTQIIENFTKAEGNFENTVKGLLRTF